MKAEKCYLHELAPYVERLNEDSIDDSSSIDYDDSPTEINE